MSESIGIDSARPSLVDPAALAFAMASSWRSLRKFVSNSANTPSMSKKHLPTAVAYRCQSIVAARSRKKWVPLFHEAHPVNLIRISKDPLKPRL